jgi:hypothetical protein
VQFFEHKETRALYFESSRFSLQDRAFGEKKELLEKR